MADEGVVAAVVIVENVTAVEVVFAVVVLIISAVVAVLIIVVTIQAFGGNHPGFASGRVSQWAILKVFVDTQNIISDNIYDIQRSVKH